MPGMITAAPHLHDTCPATAVSSMEYKWVIDYIYYAG